LLEKLKHQFIHGRNRESLSLHEAAKIDVFLNTLLLAFLIGVVGSLVMLILQAYEMLPLTVICIIVAVLTFVVSILSGSYRIPAFIFFSLWLLGLSTNILFYKEALHIASPFWLILINMLVIYILGIYVGLGSLMISSIVFIYYVKIEFSEGLERIQQLPQGVLQSAYVEVIFAMSTLGFLLWVIIEHSRKSDVVLARKNKELTEQNSIIQASNEEKTIMLKEIHHRVKNNLQIITSLLRLQMGEIQDDQAREKFKESINRVIAMAMIHEKIYQSEHFIQINIQEYFQSLGNDLIQSYETDKKIDFQLQISDVSMSMETLIPLALIFNELMTNSLKHAFLDTLVPRIDLKLYSTTPTHFYFVYKDNGKWIDNIRKNTLGSELIESFSEQIEAEMQFIHSPETTYTLRIPHAVERPFLH
jgi:two-component system, sensor histidine kinase PdtaS